MDVWHLVGAIVARQPPFLQIMSVTGAAFFVVMALEGVRTSILAMWRAHKPTLAEPPLQTDPAPMAHPGSRAFEQNNSAPIAERLASLPMRRPKALTLNPRLFRSPRPKITRHPRLEFAALSMPPEIPAPAHRQLRDAL